MTVPKTSELLPVQIVLRQEDSEYVSAESDSILRSHYRIDGKSDMAGKSSHCSMKHIHHGNSLTRE